MIKMRMKTSIFVMGKYSFRAKIQKISQMKFGLWSKTVTSALLLYSSMIDEFRDFNDFFDETTQNVTAVTFIIPM